MANIQIDITVLIDMAETAIANIMAARQHAKDRYVLGWRNDSRIGRFLRTGTLKSPDKFTDEEVWQLGLKQEWVGHLEYIGSDTLETAILLRNMCMVARVSTAVVTSKELFLLKSWQERKN